MNDLTEKRGVVRRDALLGQGVGDRFDEIRRLGVQNSQPRERSLGGRSARWS